VELASRLDRARFAPAVACFRQEAFADELAAAACHVHILPKRRACDLPLLLRLVRLIRRERFAIVHAHDLQSAAYGLLAAKAARRRSLLTIHGLGIFRQKRSAWLLPRLARRLDRVVFVGEWLQRAAAEGFGVRPRRPMVIHNGVDVAAFSPGPPDPALRAELQIEEGAPIIGSVGNLRPVKDYPCLLRAFALARHSLSLGERAGVRVPLPLSPGERAGVRVPLPLSPGERAGVRVPLPLSPGERAGVRVPVPPVLVLVGDGEERPALEALARELGIASAVRFAGARADVPRLLRLFDLFALSSQTEGISVALLEAMAAGLPAVVTDAGGNPEVALSGQTAELVPVGDPEQLGAALAALLADPARRQAWGQAARRRVEAHFSLDRMVKSYEQLYDQLLGL